MAFAPLITRLYGPEAYGIQGVFVSIVGVLGTIAAMSYPIAIVLPKSDADALSLARLSLYIGLSMSVLVTVLLFFLGLEILALLNAEAISFLMYIIPIAMLISVISRVVGQWLIRKKAFSLTAKVTVWQSLIINTIKAGLGFVHPTAAVLIVTNTLSGLLNAALMMLGSRKDLTGKKSEVEISGPNLKHLGGCQATQGLPSFANPPGVAQCRITKSSR